MPKPDIELIAGLSPSISISQKSSGTNPRSTVGTITEIHDYLRVYFARVGRDCPECGSGHNRPEPERSSSESRLAGGVRGVWCLAPLIRDQKGEYRDLFEDLLKQGFVRARVDGRVVRLTRRPAVGPADAARYRARRRPLGARAEDSSRLAEAVELALPSGGRELRGVAEENDGRRRKDEG